METKANYVLIGSFVLMAAGALALFTLWIAGNPLNRAYADFDVVFNGPVNGLSEGGEVRFNGIKVGEVRTLRLDREDPNNVIAHIRVDAQTPVRTDSIAQLNFMGITGVTFIQILAGDPKKPMLTPVNGVTPRIRSSRTLVDELFQGGQDLLGVSGETIKRLNLLLSEDNLRHFSSTLASVDKAAARISSQDGLIQAATKAFVRIDTAAAALESASKSVDAAAGSIGSDISSLRQSANQTLQDLDPLIQDARIAMGNVNTTLGQINTEITPAAAVSIQQISHAAADLQAMMARLQGLLSQIEQDPSTFIYQQPQPVER